MKDNQTIKKIDIDKSPKLKRGIDLLPNGLTLFALFCGFWSVIMAINGNFVFACIGIAAAVIFDGLDGRVARLTNSASNFGKELDSLSDVISFGVAPAIIAYLWALNSIGDLGLAVAFMYASCAAIRLAKFNVLSGGDMRFFSGISSPVAAVLVTSWIWLVESSSFTLANSAIIAITTALTLIAAVLMVSRIKYYSFKVLDRRQKVPFVVLPFIATIIAIITVNPPVVLFTMSCTYCLFGVLWWQYSLLQQRRKRRKG